MPNPHIVVIALAANELSSPHTASMLKSAREILGPTTAVRVEVVDENARGQGSPKAPPNSDYAWLAWDRYDSRVAHLRCYMSQSNRWVQRDVSFEPQDPESERGRTLGFLIASTFVEGREPQLVPSVPAPTRPSVTVKKKRFLITAAAAVAGPGDVTSLGAWASTQRYVSHRFALGLAGEARFGTVTAAQSGSRFLSFGAVTTFRAWPSSGSAWIGIQSLLGTEFVAFTHRSEDDPSAVVQSAWLPKLDLLLHGSLELEGASVLFADIGANYRFGETAVYVHGLRQAHIPAFVGVGHIGIGARF